MWRANLQLANIVEESVEIGTPISLDEAVRAVSAGVGTKVYFNCSHGKYVSEIWTCFSVEKEQMDCPGNLEVTCASEVTFDPPNGRTFGLLKVE